MQQPKNFIILDYT